jgi:hypothetical protein
MTCQKLCCIKFNISYNFFLQIKAKAEEWEQNASVYFNQTFSSNLAAIFLNYSDLVLSFDKLANLGFKVFSFTKTAAPAPLLANNLPSGATHPQLLALKFAREEGAAFQKICTLRDTALGALHSADRLGIETNFHVCAHACIAAIEWIHEARMLCCAQFVCRMKSSSVGITSGKHHGGKKAKLAMLGNDTGAWDDLKEPEHLGGWNDVDSNLVSALLSEGERFLDSVSADQLAAVAQLQVAQFKNTMLDVATAASGKASSSSSVASAEDLDDNDDDAMDEETGVEANDDENSTAPGRATKKPRIQGSPEIEVKSTRGMHGIVKKKVDSEFSKDLNLNRRKGEAVARGGKKQRKTEKVEADADADEDAQVEAAAVDVPLNADKTKRRSSLFEYLTTCDETTDGPCILHALATIRFVDLWVRVLKVYTMRLQSAQHWSVEARRILRTVRLSSETSSCPDVGEEVERLLAEATAETIESKLRYVAVIYSFFFYVFELR